MSEYEYPSDFGDDTDEFFWGPEINNYKTVYRRFKHYVYAVVDRNDTPVFHGMKSECDELVRKLNRKEIRFGHL